MQAQAPPGQATHMGMPVAGGLPMPIQMQMPMPMQPMPMQMPTPIHMPMEASEAARPSSNVEVALRVRPLSDAEVRQR